MWRATGRMRVRSLRGPNPSDLLRVLNSKQAVQICTSIYYSLITSLSNWVLSSLTTCILARTISTIFQFNTLISWHKFVQIKQTSRRQRVRASATEEEPHGASTPRRRRLAASQARRPMCVHDGARRGPEGTGGCALALARAPEGVVLPIAVAGRAGQGMQRSDRARGRRRAWCFLVPSSAGRPRFLDEPGCLTVSPTQKLLYIGLKKVDKYTDGRTATLRPPLACNRKRWKPKHSETFCCVSARH